MDRFNKLLVVGVVVLALTILGSAALAQDETLNGKLIVTPGNGSTQKISLYNLAGADDYGFGVSANQLNYHTIGAGDRHVFYAGGNNGPGGGGSPTELMRIQGNGNVGIGLVPTQRLEVAGNIYTNGGRFLTGTGQGLAWANDPTYRLDFTSIGDISLNPTDGNVGIGTTMPLARLSITPGAGNEQKIQLLYGGADDYGFGISAFQLNYHVIGVNDSHVFYAGGTNGPIGGGTPTELMRIRGNGNVEVTGDIVANNIDAKDIYVDVDGDGVSETSLVDVIKLLMKPGASGIARYGK